MAEPFRPDFPGNSYRVDPIYARMTLARKSNDNRFSLPSVQELFGELSVTSQFKVTLFMGDTVSPNNSDSDINAWLVSCGILGSNLKSLSYEFMCNETVLPGTTLTTSEEFGSRQGLTETFPTKRNFEPITMTFYVDSEYGIIRLFEEWINFINPLYDNNQDFVQTAGRRTTGNPRGGVDRFGDNEFFRFRYPNTYKRPIAVTKFERNFTQLPDGVSNPTMLTYKMLNAYPTNLTALPVTYEGSTITKTTVTFAYDRYVILKNSRSNIEGRSSNFGTTRTINERFPLITSPTIHSGNPLPTSFNPEGAPLF
jgi:hypothetical protein